MGVLRSETRNQILLKELKVATTFWRRGKGLLGVRSLGPQEGLWISQTNSIHTFFMKMSIDCVFLDKSFRVKKIYSSVPPFRMIWPVWGARSVVEIPAGRAKELELNLGEQLHVGA